MTRLYRKPTIVFEKVATFSLSHNIAEWHDEIMQHVMSNHEYLSQFLAPGVEWDDGSIDEERGTAYGKMYLSRGDQTAWIPIIVKDFDLQPVDTFFVGDDGYVLTEDSVDENLPMSNDVGSISMPVGVLKRRARVMSKLSHVNPERLERYHKHLQDPDMAFITRKSGTNEKLAGMIDAFATPTKEASEQIGTTRVYDYIPGQMKLATDYRYGRKVGVRQLNDKIASEKLDNGIASEWEQVSGVIPGSHFIVKQAEWGVIRDPGQYKVKLENGEHAFIICSPISALKSNGEIISGDQKGAVAFGDSLEGKLMYVTGDVLYGERFSKKYDFSSHVVALSEMQEGQTGILMIPTEDGAANMGRIRIIERKTLPSKRSRLSIKAMINGQPAYHFLISNKLSTPVEIDSNDPLFYQGAKNFEIPNNWEVAILDGEVALSDTAGPAKLAGASVRLTPDGLDHWRFEKVSDDGTRRSDLETTTHMAARLVSMGFNGDLHEIVKEAQERGEIMLSGLRDRPLVDKTAQELPSYASRQMARITHHSRANQMETLKLASALISEVGEAAGDSVDSVLSLGLVDDENIQFFVDSIPDFESVLQALVKLLLKARLGMESVDPVTVKKAVTYLEATIRDLKDLRRTATRN